MDWYGTDWHPAEWFGPDWHASGLAPSDQGPWYGPDWHAADWHAPGWDPDAGGPPALEPGWFGAGWHPAEWFGPDWHGFEEAPTEWPFVASGPAATLTITGHAGVYRTRFVGRGAQASVGLVGRHSGFLPDPGGILDNDSDPDGEPLSYEIVTQPEAGTLTAYAGGGFTWTPGAAPPGRYRFTYRLWAGGEQAASLGVVTIEYGDLFASVGVEGFGGQLTGFSQPGTRATMTVTGFAGTLVVSFVARGTAAEVTTTGFARPLRLGQRLRGDAGTLALQGFGGLLSNQFVGRGDTALLDVEGYAGTLDLTAFFNDRGTAATVTVTGFEGRLTGFIEAGQAASVGAEGLDGRLRLGLNGIQGAAAEVTVSGGIPGDPPRPPPGRRIVQRRKRRVIKVIRGRQPI